MSNEEIVNSAVTKAVTKLFLAIASMEQTPAATPHNLTEVIRSIDAVRHDVIRRMVCALADEAEKEVSRDARTLAGDCPSADLRAE